MAVLFPRIPSAGSIQLQAEVWLWYPSDFDKVFLNFDSGSLAVSGVRSQPTGPSLGALPALGLPIGSPLSWRGGEGG